MRTKLILSTKKTEVEHWIDLPFVPRLGEYLAVNEMIDENSLKILRFSADSWSGQSGLIERVEHHLDNQGSYVEMLIWCED
jgi:hypothetical protein